MKKTMALLIALAAVFMISGAVYAAEWVSISGTVLYEDEPLNVMVLANGQYMFTDAADGRYELEVPLDENGEITLFSFCDGLAPFKEILGPDEAKNFDVIMTAAPSESMEMILTYHAEPLDE